MTSDECRELAAAVRIYTAPYVGQTPQKNKDAWNTMVRLTRNICFTCAPSDTPGWMMHEDGQPCPICTPKDGSMIGGTGTPGAKPQQGEDVSNIIDQLEAQVKAERVGYLEMKTERDSLRAENERLTAIARNDKEIGGQLQRQVDNLFVERANFFDTIRAIAVDGLGLSDPFAADAPEGLPHDWAKHKTMSGAIASLRAELVAAASAREAAERAAEILAGALKRIRGGGHQQSSLSSAWDCPRRHYDGARCDCHVGVADQALADYQKIKEQKGQELREDMK